MKNEVMHFCLAVAFSGIVYGCGRSAELDEAKAIAAADAKRWNTDDIRLVIISVPKGIYLIADGEGSAAEVVAYAKKALTGIALSNLKSIAGAADIITDEIVNVCEDLLAVVRPAPEY